MNDFSLKGKKILITGASSGIGQQTAISISNAGGEVVITGRDINKLTKTYNQLQTGGHSMIKADLTNNDDLNILINSLSGLDGIVHCAGILDPLPIKFITQERISKVFKINYEAQVLLMALLTKMKKINNNCSVVFVTTVSTQFPYVGGALYTGSKAAIESFSKTFAMEFAVSGIRSNCIAPAMVKTPMYDKAVEDSSQEQMDSHISKYMLGAGRSDDIANAAIYLLSPASRWITGTTLIADGGYLLS